MDLLAFIRENALSHIVILIGVIMRYILNTNVGQYSPFQETYSLGLDFLSNLGNIGVRVSAFRNKLSNMQKIFGQGSGSFILSFKMTSVACAVLAQV
jgi:hypothetical protein